MIFRTGGLINISARSYGKLNVQLVMEAMGGGGHRSMAAVQLEGLAPADAEKRLIAAIEKTYPD